MIVKLTQKLTNFDVSYAFERDNTIICKAFAPFQMGRFDMNIKRNDGTDYYLRLNPRQGNSLKERFTFRLYDGDSEIGTFVGVTKKTGRFFGGYQYYQIGYQGVPYEMFAVGLGTQGLYICLYQAGKLVSMAEKQLTVVDYQDVYHLYLSSEEFFPVFATSLMYYDVISFGDFMEITTHSRKTRVPITTNQELRNKYDPTFIPRIIDMEG